MISVMIVRKVSHPDHQKIFVLTGKLPFIPSEGDSINIGSLRCLVERTVFTINKSTVDIWVEPNNNWWNKSEEEVIQYAQKQLLDGWKIS